MELKFFFIFLFLPSLFFSLSIFALFIYSCWLLLMFIGCYVSKVIWSFVFKSKVPSHSNTRAHTHHTTHRQGFPRIFSNPSWHLVYMNVFWRQDACPGHRDYGNANIWRQRNMTALIMMGSLWYAGMIKEVIPVSRKLTMNPPFETWVVLSPAWFGYPGEGCI